ncbi:hypothetical protein [Nocardia sp. A7]|uniref:hypothetical protein n=1 Tax=Nocardia sp. A7 TaxID=2789274 RepID=UPI00397D681F
MTSSTAGELDWFLGDLVERMVGVRQPVIELDRAVLFATTVGSNSCLALQAEDSANLGSVGTGPFPLP